MIKTIATMAILAFTLFTSSESTAGFNKQVLDYDPVICANGLKKIGKVPPHGLSFKFYGYSDFEMYCLDKSGKKQGDYKRWGIVYGNKNRGTGIHFAPQLREKGKFRDDIRVGKWTVYKGNGHVRDVRNYDENERNDNEQKNEPQLNIADWPWWGWCLVALLILGFIGWVGEHWDEIVEGIKTIFFLFLFGGFVWLLTLIFGEKGGMQVFFGLCFLMILTLPFTLIKLFQQGRESREKAIERRRILLANETPVEREIREAREEEAREERKREEEEERERERRRSYESSSSNSSSSSSNYDEPRRPYNSDIP